MPEGHDEQSGSADDEVVLRTLASAFFDALLSGDGEAAEITVREAIDFELTEQETADEIIGPAMRRIGHLWELGEISVAEEHLATQITLRVLALQREAFRTARARLDRRVALAAVEGEEHVVGLQMVSSLLQHSGYDVSYYGPDLPVSALERVVYGRAPHVFGFSASLTTTAPALRASIDEVRALKPDIAVVVGGRGIPRGLHSGPWLWVAEGLAGVVDRVDALLRRPDLN